MSHDFHAVGAIHESPLRAEPQCSAVPQRNRRSIRLQGYDSSRAGAYFVTICTQNRECLFGDIVNGEMRLNDVGRIVGDEWLKTAEIRAEIELDEWVVMPNHFHGILVLSADVGAIHESPLRMTVTQQMNGEIAV